MRTRRHAGIIERGEEEEASGLARFAAARFRMKATDELGRERERE